MRGRAMAWLAALMLAGVVEAEETFVTIGTGGQTGVYFATGQSICAFLNQRSSEHGIRCNATASGGGIANVHGMRNGEFDFGVMQADHLFKAREGLGPFHGEVAMSDIRALFTLQREVFTVLARRDAGIQGLDDLPGKRINIGNPGSGQRDTLEEIMVAKGWDRSTFALASELKAAEQASALGEDNIDAMTYFVGHPNGRSRRPRIRWMRFWCRSLAKLSSVCWPRGRTTAARRFPRGCTRATHRQRRRLEQERCWRHRRIPTRRWCTSWSRRCSITLSGCASCIQPLPSCRPVK